MKDGSGRRVGRKVNGIITQKWLYSNDLRIIAELDSANRVVSRFVYTTSENVPEYMVRADTIYRLITDQLGSVRQIVNMQNGIIVQQVEYDEYGIVIFDTNPGFTPFGFAGGLVDRGTRLVRFGARDYDAVAGRWAEKDPIGFESGDGNLFVYLTSDPVNGIDTKGLWLSAGHTELTEKAMQERPFSDVQIGMAVRANVGVDKDSPWYNEMHCMPEGDIRISNLLSQFYLGCAIMADVNPLEGRDQAVFYLGTGLHIVQDYYSHYDQGLGGSYAGHLPIIIPYFPDSRRLHGGQYEKAKRASRNYVDKFLSGRIN